MNKQHLTSLVGQTITVTFKNGETQCGRLAQSADQSTQFTVGRYGAPFDVRAVADVTGGGKVVKDTQRGTVTRKSPDTPRYVAMLNDGDGKPYHSIGNTKGVDRGTAKAQVETYFSNMDTFKRGWYFDWKGQQCTVLNGRGNPTGYTGSIKRLAKGSGQTPPTTLVRKGRASDRKSKPRAGMTVAEKMGAVIAEAAPHYKRYMQALRAVDPKIARHTKIIDMGMGFPSMVYVPLWEQGEGATAFFALPQYSANGDYFCGWQDANGNGDGKEFTKRTKPDAVARHFVRMVAAADKAVAA